MVRKTIFTAVLRDKIGEIIDTIHKDSPKTQIYLESILPVIDGRIGPYQNKNINSKIKPCLT